MMPDKAEPFQLQMMRSCAAAQVTEPFRAMDDCKAAAPPENTVRSLEQLLQTAGILAGSLRICSAKRAASGRYKQITAA